MGARRFLLKALLFGATALVVGFVLHELLYELHLWSRTRKDPRAIYLLGDSRSVHGIDIETLGARLGRPVYSHATHGASAYAFLALAERVPPGATVLMAPSHGMLVRDKEKVTYDSALSLRGLMLMLEEGYEPWYFRRVLADNRFPLAAPFSKINREPFPVKDETVPLRQRFDEIYQKPAKPWHYGPNQRLLLESVRLLVAKGCDVRLLEMPVSPTLRTLIASSVYKGLFGDLPELAQIPGTKVFRDVALPEEPGRNIWYDYDHLNVRGRALMTDWILANVFAPVATSTGAAR